MSETEIGGLIVTVILAAGGGLLGFLRWASGGMGRAFGAWMADKKEERSDRKNERALERELTIQNTKAMTELAVRFENFGKKLDETRAATVAMAVDFESKSGVHDLPGPHVKSGPKKKRIDTQPMGVVIERNRRVRTEGDSDA